jgi:hypothetical protein
VHDIGNGSTTLTSLLEFSYIRIDSSNRIKGPQDSQSVVLLRWITCRKQRLSRCSNTVRYLAGNVSFSSNATCRMTNRGINKTTPAYDLKRGSAISAFSSRRLAGCRHVAARTKVQERYKIGKHPPSVRHRPGPCILQAKSRKPQHIDIWKKWIGATNRRFPHHFGPS